MQEIFTHSELPKVCRTILARKNFGAILRATRPEAFLPNQKPKCESLTRRYEQPDNFQVPDRFYVFPLSELNAHLHSGFINSARLLVVADGSPLN